ncbi:histidinol-phosphate transaminase [Thauera aromatica]|uniref:histidinol-phosphate transaminase n=1 Tax=Thauera aromatica TaxID=59405 RepID=UPI001FFC30AE|nr:histidinol-phosphate transaminase [Thauera aromatica]MCK2088844.1 histidinol-phosphate transaminase [Thauera aromatica]
MSAELDFGRHLDTLIPEYVRNFEAYVPSKPDQHLMREYGAPFLCRMNNNENPLGPPPAARQAMEAYSVDLLSLYPSGDAYDLRAELAARFDLSANRFLVGNGSCEVIGSIIKAFCERGDNIVTADKTFAVYEWVAEFSGIEARLAPLRDHAFDPEAMLSRIDRRTKIVFVCNPNNPTGTYWPADVLVDFIKRVDERCIVVVDEAYFEYVDKPDYPNAMSLMERFPNVVVFRTFSKMYALASLRIGFMAGSTAVIEAVRRTYVTYSVNTLAQVAAQAALADLSGHVVRSRQMVCEARTALTRLCAELELPTVGGEGNYLMIKVPINDTLMYRRLMRRGIMIRSMTGFRFPGWIRVTLRESEAMARFAEIFTDEIRQLRQSAHA